MMKKTRVAVIDSGISVNTPAYNAITQCYHFNDNQEIEELCSQEISDSIGHGTAVCNLIYKENPNIEFILFTIDNSDFAISGELLSKVLDFIYFNINIDIINISAGTTYVDDLKQLELSCNKLVNKGVLIVSAFDNEGAISYPAAYNSVIGIDTIDSYERKSDILVNDSNVVDIHMANRYFRTNWLEGNTIVKGTSFAAANFTGMLSKKIEDFPLKKQNPMFWSIFELKN